MWTRKHYNCQKLTNEQKQNHEQTNQCHFCKKPFITNKNHEKYQKLKNLIDHDHYSGKYRSAAHSICNLRATRSNEIFVGIHNGSGYNFKLLLKKFAFHFKQDISVIAETIEKYMSFSFVIAETETDAGQVAEDDEPIIKTIKHRIRFVDTNRLLTAPLDTCVNNLSELFECNCKDKKKQAVKLSHNDTDITSKCKTCLKRTNHLIKEMKEKFPCTSKFAKNRIDKFKLFLRKGVYP